MPDLNATRQRLERAGQGHLLRFHDELAERERAALLAQIDALDLESLPALVDAYVRNKPVYTLPPGVKPARYFPADPASPSNPWDHADMFDAGEKLVRAGKVAAFVVAGGQGSRLGFEGPKGCFPAGVITEKSLFQLFAEYLLGVGDRYGTVPPFYVMTSPLNHDATVEFFRANRNFGLREDGVMFFRQGVMPSLDIHTGKVLLAGKGEVATNPDGHGGSITALHASGALADMRRRGVEHISYFQVDNPHTKVIDPVFIGLHAAGKGSSGEMSSKMIAKRAPEEKVGMFCEVDGKVEVVEYSDLPMDLQRERESGGRLRFVAGNAALHMLSVEFVGRLATDPSFALPYHRAEKKVECVDPATGAEVKPAAPNAVKLERFVFDALPRAKASVVLEVDRVEEFAPIKNATGADSVESSHALQTLRAARWLAACGVGVPMKPDGTPDCVLEVSPRTATRAEELKRADLPSGIKPGSRVSL